MITSFTTIKHQNHCSAFNQLNSQPNHNTSSKSNTCNTSTSPCS